MPFTPICVPCAREMRCRKNGYFFKEDADTIWAGDMYECEACGHQVVTGVGRGPVATAYTKGTSFYRAEPRIGFTLNREKA